MSDRIRVIQTLTKIGLSSGLHLPPLAPALLPSIGVAYPEDIWAKAHGSYTV
ncbi:MAG: hypothetical protein WAU00_13110 [Caldilinea sp.]|uniref:hypothetical protein n=1 Tax=Caldilinea sp. TaxID=2293560 RepID=UPI002C44D696|nr:hypothetical protein [Anaerolineales bacterium]HQY92910.1 hypothetical protein [Caldilinea sp.]HRA68148.1 hypothetical protein [Caldilinea sp.]